jgi:hypothetical protein
MEGNCDRGSVILAVISVTSDKEYHPPNTFCWYALQLLVRGYYRCPDVVLEYRQELKRVPGVLGTLTETLTTIVVLPVRVNMATEILKATVTDVQIGNISVEGLKLETGEYAIAQQQVATLFQIHQSKASRWLKNILGMDFQFTSARTNRNPQAPRQNRPEKCLDLDSFALVIKWAAERDYPMGKTLAIAFIGLSLKQVWADAFGDEFGSGDRQQYLKSRIKDEPSKYQPYYFKEMCQIGFKYFGYHFYWIFFYDILTTEERCKLNLLNPINPTTGRRFEKIHQYLDDETKERLYPKVYELHALLKASNSRQEFLMLIGRINGLDQLELFPSIS